MSNRIMLKTLSLGLLSLAIGFSLLANAQSAEPVPADKAMQDGMYADAYRAYYDRLITNEAPSSRPAKDLRNAIDCLNNLGRISEVDAVLEQTVGRYSKNPSLLIQAAQTYQNSRHYGTLIGGEFKRGDHSGQRMYSNQRDRVLALSLAYKAWQLLLAEDDEKHRNLEKQTLEVLLRSLCDQRLGQQAWRLQSLTKLDEVPDYEARYTASQSYAPVTTNGDPVLYELPDSWNSAKSDGERWRWLSAMIAERDVLSGERGDWARRAAFLQSQFGVQTVADLPLRRLAREGDDKQPVTHPFDLTTLKETETIARLATGVKRLELPEEHNHVALYKRLLADSRSRIGAADNLARIAESRLQMPLAAEYWQTALEAARESKDKYNTERAEKNLARITKPWSQFEPVSTQPAGTGLKLSMRHRNTERINFQATTINVEKLLGDVKKYLRDGPKKLDWERLQVDNIGYRLVRTMPEKYLSEVAAKWATKVKSPENHFDSLTDIATPLQEPGAYLIEAVAEGGNTSYVVAWVADTAIVRKPGNGQTLYYVADAVTGKPLPGMTLELFGYRQQNQRKPNAFEIITDTQLEKTNDQGLAIVPGKADKNNGRMQWLTTASSKEGRLAYLGFNSVWYGQHTQKPSLRKRAYLITDRPAYRPGQTVQFKAWIARARYDSDEPSEFSHQAFKVEVYDARNQKIHEATLTANSYGGIVGEFALEAEASLGQYRLQVVGHDSLLFRVEEYRKPEYEVSVDTPQEAVRLGQAFDAKISAKYYFGAPVTQAEVTYKVTRTVYQDRWFPYSPWDWLYGPGFWWFDGNGLSVTPRHRFHGGRGGFGGNWWQPTPPPEVVAQGETSLDADGNATIPIDTALAAQLHGDQDHRYQISVTVTDPSRRAITGQGSVIVSRRPLEATVWLDQGHYQVGQTATANVYLRRPGGKAEAAQGKFRLLRLSYDETSGKASKEVPNEEPVKTGETATAPTETEVRSWEVTTNRSGQASLQIKTSVAGQYRLVFQTNATATAEDEPPVTADMLFTIHGEGDDGSDYEFDDLVLSLDKQTYQPGDTAKLLVATRRAGSSVLLFLRPQQSVYLEPQLLRITGKTQLVDIELTAEDQPNIFVEAVTVSDGKVHQVVRQIALPPQKRQLNVEVLPSAKAYQPGQEAELKVKLTDLTGEPYVGELVASMYDRSIEAISGGSNIGDIRKHFWSWTRSHHPQSQHSLAQIGYNLVRPGVEAMQPLSLEPMGPPSRVSSRSSLRGGASFGLEMSSSGVVPATAPAMSFGDTDFYTELSGRRQKYRRSLDDSLAVADVIEADAESSDLVEPTVRKNFADTAYWTGSLMTNERGIATFNVTMPESLTDWMIRVWGMGHGVRVGQGDAAVVTRKNLLVRLQKPRFLVERDEVVLSANVHNYLATDKEVRVRLELAGNTLETPSQPERTITVPADGQVRCDWRVKALSEGKATLKVLAQTDEESDAVEQTLPVLVHGMLQLDAYSGVIGPNARIGTFEIDVPEKRRPKQTRLLVQYSPTLAATMLDALPYLIEYPHGCTEQTLNRFLPAVITSKTLQQMGISLEDLKQQRAGLNPQRVDENGAKEIANKPQDPAEKRANDPDRPLVFDQAELDRVVKAGTKRLMDMQLSDGGWGWFSGTGERSSAHTTAVVVRGLQEAASQDVAIMPGVIDRGIEWLKRYQTEQLAKLANVNADGKVIDKTKPYKHNADNVDALVLLVLSKHESSRALPEYRKMASRLFEDRLTLSRYAMAMVGVAAHRTGNESHRDTILNNLKQFLVRDAENQTAMLDLPENGWWYWYGSTFETHAYFLKLLVATEPKSDLTAGVVKYLVNNRRNATYWNSTRDTALVIEALAEYLKASDELTPNLEIEVWVDGEKRKAQQVTKENLLSADLQFSLTGLELEPGRHTIELRKRGTGRLYYNGYLSNFSLEDDLRSAGLEVKVERRLVKLTPQKATAEVAGSTGQVINQATEAYDRTSITNLSLLKSGDLIEVELIVTSKNDYEYLLISDPKAAGFEAMSQQSGYTGNALGAYVEYRDQSVDFFVQRLARGEHSLRYRLRAETPGQFAALPTVIQAMYAPELRGNSDEIKVRIEDRPSQRPKKPAAAE